MHCILDSACYATLHCPLHPRLLQRATIFTSTNITRSDGPGSLCSVKPQVPVTFFILVSITLHKQTSKNCLAVSLLPYISASILFQCISDASLKLFRIL